ncbi:MAG TPA: CopG family transcriptional regulator [Solirubrobacteraceae bacterium]|nr:CopG family transcriptional regulator [Solirubrobacteraceae bacterium]
MEIHDSARNHGVVDEDIHHATGHTRSGQPITDAEVEALAAEAEAGYDVDQLIARRPKRGRPALGSSPASVESVRLDPELRRQLLQRARSEGTTASAIIREALRRFLRAA